MTIRFDDRVAIVTGAGNGLGRSHALSLAARGAKVVVNDLGGAVDGTGGSASAAEQVAEEIRATAGEAIANGANVTDAGEVAAMVEQAMSEWGRVDILVNNAGILRDKSFAKMELSDFATVLAVHLTGSVTCTKAVWDIMREQAYGRIAMTTSSSGLYGNFGQANYGAAKMALVGLMHTLVLEGQKYDIRINALSPVAATRMTESLFPPEALAKFTPESVTPGLLYLVSEDAPNRTVLTAGAGGYARAVISETDGIYLEGDDQTPEAIAERWAEAGDAATAKEYRQGHDQTMKFLAKAGVTLG